MTDEKSIPTKDAMLPTEIENVPLEQETQSAVSNILKANDIKSLKEVTSLFNLTIAKKNAIRIAKLNNLLDLVNDQAIARFTERPDEISNKEVLDYMKTVQEQISLAQQMISNAEEQPTSITLNQQNNTIIVNEGDEMSGESKERVINAVKSLIQQIKSSQSQPNTSECDIEEVKEA